MNHKIQIDNYVLHPKHPNSPTNRLYSSSFTALVRDEISLNASSKSAKVFLLGVFADLDEPAVGREKIGISKVTGVIGR